MAKQSGLFPLEGTLGSTTFVRSKNGGFYAKWKTGLTKEKMAANANYARLREQNSEFGRSKTASKLLRNTLQPIIGTVNDSGMSNRLDTLMLKAAQMDATSPLGLRNVLDGELALLQGFEFSGNGSFLTNFQPEYQVNYKRTTGSVAVSIEPFVPLNALTVAPTATHFKLSMLTASINFETGVTEKKLAATEQLPVNQVATAPINLAAKIAAAATDPVFIAMRIDFSILRNDLVYPLLNNAFNCCAIVLVDTGV